MKFFERISVGFLAFLFFKIGLDIIAITVLVLSIRSVYLLLKDYGKKLPIFRFLLTVNYFQIALTPLQFYIMDLDYSMVGTRFSMQVDYHEYFRYVLGCLLAMEVIFLFDRKGNDLLEKVYESINSNSNYYVRLAFKYIMVGVVFTTLLPMIPLTFQFIFLLLSNAYILGALIIYNTNYQHRNKVLAFLSLFLVISSMRHGMYINLFVWLAFILHYVDKRYKISLPFKLILTIPTVILVVVLNFSKYQYRTEVWEGNADASATRMIEIMVENSQNSSTINAGITALSIRLNQGFLLSQIMDNKEKGNINNSYLSKEVVSILLPRFLYPGKLFVNSPEKISDYTGLPINKGVALSVGIHGDGYANYGRIGGIIFLAAFYSLLVWLFNRLSKISTRNPPIAFIIPYIYFYVLRPGSEFYIVGNWIFKTLIIMLFLLLLFPSFFRAVKYESLSGSEKI